jgi:DNA polymerase III delta subunit
MVFGLLCSQAFQLAALAAADKPGSEVARDIGAHPFALQKLAPHVKRLGRGGTRRVIESFAQADDRLKSGPADPWVLIDQALARIAAI